MATQQQLDSLAKAREARTRKKQAILLAREAEAARAAETTQIIEEYKEDAREEGIENPLPPQRNRVIRQTPRAATVRVPERPPVVVADDLGTIEKIVLSAGWGNHHFILDLKEGTWESRSNSTRGNIVFRGSGPVLRIDCDNLRKSQFGHIERDGGSMDMDVTRYDRVRDIEEFTSLIQETRSAYPTSVDENSLFEDNETETTFQVEGEVDDSFDVDFDTDEDDLPDVSLETFYGEGTREEEPVNDDGDDEGDLVDGDLLAAMDEADADLVNISDLQDDEETDDEPPFTTEEEDDDGEY